MGANEEHTEIMLLPVSIGEAVDKLTILDIKMSKITDDRRKDVEYEYNLLYEKLNSFVSSYKFYYDSLLKINLNIWELQDDFRDNENLSGEDYTRICKVIIEENDRRFRVKYKINNLSKSSIKEQKGYKKRQIIVGSTIYENNSMANIIKLIGAIRYFATVYDEVTIMCMANNVDDLQSIFDDDPSIKFNNVNKDEYNNILNNSNILLYANNLYKDLGLDDSISVNYFYINPTDKATQIYKNEIDK
jgi:hypothetical protein